MYLGIDGIDTYTTAKFCADKRGTGISWDFHVLKLFHVQV